MLHYHIPLAHWENGDRVCLRELNGEDQDSVNEVSTISAIRLLNRLLTAEPGAALGPGDSAKMSASDRDRLLASVYSHTYGPRIDSTTDCQRCGTPFDLDFSLDALQATLTQNKNKPAAEAESNGIFRLANGCRFRLPTGEDELSVSGISPEKARSALLEKCIVNDTSPNDPEIILNAMNELAPIVDLELDAICPECEHKQSVHFDIQSYLLTTIIQERNQLVREVHQLASTYGWSLGEIMGLARSRRRALTSLIESERTGA